MNRGFRRGRSNSWAARWRGARRGYGRFKPRGAVNNVPPVTDTNIGDSNDSGTENYVGIANDPSRNDHIIHAISESQLSSAPYPGWHRYFSGKEWIENDDTDKKIKTCLILCYKHCQVDPEIVIESGGVTMDIKTITDDSEFLQDWGSFSEDLHNNPEHTLNCLGLALHQMVLEKKKAEGNENFEEDNKKILMLRFRVAKVEPLIQLKLIKSTYCGKLVTVRGTVIRVSGTKLLCTWMVFECVQCQAIQSIRQPEGVYTVPTSCMQCKSRNFSPQLDSTLTFTVGCQKIRIQECNSDAGDDQEGGRVPRTIDVELLDDLIETCSPGDIIIVTGIIKARKEDEGKASANATGMYVMYIEAIHILNMSRHSKHSPAVIQFGLKDYYAINQMHEEKDIFRLLVHSLCPAIFGHDLVKAGILLCLAGGSTRRGAGEVTGRRSEPHMLIVGDPGLGKSRLLHATSHVAPRGVYVCGNTSTAAGLTVTVKSGGAQSSGSSGGNDLAIEAGALLLADGGCCCIDEFDKMTEHHQSLMEAMEQQTVSVAKAGLVCTLPARASIIAAANPVGGHYTRAKTIAENLKLGPALLSRFDLVFILLDQPDAQLDNLLSEHVMALHAGVRAAGSSSNSSRPSSRAEGDENMNEQSMWSQHGNTLLSRLKLQPNEELDLIPTQLVRKYIAYARKYINPRLGTEAAKILQDFYLQLRGRTQTADSTPVTTRQLESLIRLSEARAKLDLREEVTENDANETIALLRASMADIGLDNHGTLLLDRSLDGTASSSTNQAKKFVAALQKRAQLQMRNTFTVAELKEVAKLAGLAINNFASFLNNLNLHGFLLKKGPQTYQLLAAEF